LGGYAGTGKTTVLLALADALPDFAVCAFTGRAASVLRADMLIVPDPATLKIGKLNLALLNVLQKHRKPGLGGVEVGHGKFPCRW
jgi:hypothetical protein